MQRLFVALKPPPAIRAQLIALQSGVEGARWQDDDQLHLTLRFIGEVDRRTAADIADVLEGVHAPHFQIALSGVGTFDKRGSVDALWAGVAPVEPLAALHRKIDHAAVRAGLAPEGRAYCPHISLARGRMGSVERFLVDHAALASAPFSITEFGLYESRIGREGAVYEEHARFALS